MTGKGTTTPMQFPYTIHDAAEDAAWQICVIFLLVDRFGLWHSVAGFLMAWALAYFVKWRK